MGMQGGSQGSRVPGGIRTVISWEDLTLLSCSSLHPSTHPPIHPSLPPSPGLQSSLRSSLLSLCGGFQIACFPGNQLANSSRAVPAEAGGGRVGGVSALMLPGGGAWSTEPWCQEQFACLQGPLTTLRWAQQTGPRTPGILMARPWQQHNPAGSSAY